MKNNSIEFGSFLRVYSAEQFDLSAEIWQKIFTPMKQSAFGTNVN